MPYSAEISRANPMCFVFLLDQSGSMRKPFGGHSAVSKALGVAESINRFLYELVLSCSGSEGVKDRYYVDVVGYGGTAKSLLHRNSDGGHLVKISEIAASPMRIEQRVRKIDDGAGGYVEQAYKFPIWFDPEGSGTTVMEDAFNIAHRSISEFLSSFPNCFPPIVINITDGAAHSNPEHAATKLRSLASTDGKVLLFNAHISHLDGNAIEFPATKKQLPDDHARMLFGMSSALPDSMIELAQLSGFELEQGARGFVFNANMASVTRFIEFGTITARHQVPDNRRLGFKN